MLSFYENAFFFFFKISLIKSNVFGFQDFLQTSFRGILILMPIISLISEALESFDSLKKKQVSSPKIRKISNIIPKLQFRKKRSSKLKKKMSVYKTIKLHQLGLMNQPGRNFFRIRGSLYKEEKMDFFRVTSNDHRFQKNEGSEVLRKRKTRLQNESLKKFITESDTDEENFPLKQKKFSRMIESLRKHVKKRVNSKNFIQIVKINHLLLLKKKFWLYRKLNLPLHYLKNVLIYCCIIFGMTNLTQNLFLVLNIQCGYLVWLGLSVEREKVTSIWFIIQEIYFHVYLLMIIFYYVDFQSSFKRNLIAMGYFFGILFSAFIATVEVLDVMIISPLKKLVGSKNKEDNDI